MDGKRCRDCGDEKPLEEFPLHKGGKHGRHPLGKPCRGAQERRRYQRDRESLLAQMRSDPKRKQRSRRMALRRWHGMTLEEYEELWVRQSGCCAICERRMLRLLVDHDHATGELRGLLCSSCNFGVGDLRDDAEICRRAATYLRTRAEAVT